MLLRSVSLFSSCCVFSYHLLSISLSIFVSLLFVADLIVVLVAALATVVL